MNRKKIIIILVTVVTLLLIFSFNLSSDFGDDEDEIYTYIENTYGFSDKTVKAKFSSITSKDGNKSTCKKKGEFVDDSKGGTVFYKNIVKDKKEQLVCIYLDENTYNNISVNCTIREKDEQGNTKSKTFDLAMPHLKSRCYFTIKGSNLICVELAEMNEGWIDDYYYLSYDWDKSLFDSSDNLEYEESVKIYDLDNECNEVININRTIDPLQDGEIKQCEININDEKYKYGSGITYVYNGEYNLINTEQEFCDMANEILSDNEVNWVKFNRTCWENRWYRLEVNETNIPDKLSKIDFSTTSGKLKNNTVTSDILIKMNTEKEEIPEELADEGPDKPIEYILENNQSNNNTITSEQTTSFDIDGFWYSSDYRYVYRIYTKQSDGGFNTFCFANIKSGGKHIHYGTVQQTSSYGITLKPREDDEEIRELVVDGQALKADDFVLYKVDDNISNNIIGTWQDGNVTYLFKNDGTYNYKDSKKSYWGFYFVIDENQIVLGKQSSQLTLNEYSIESNILKINSDEELKKK